MNYLDIIRKIYEEQDVPRNIAIFFAGIAGLVVYLRKGDAFISILLILIIFPLIKVLANVLLKIKSENTAKKIAEVELSSQFSENELSVIKLFIKQGTCRIPFEQEEQLNFNREGLLSLVERNFIEVVDNTMIGHPSWYSLDEETYIKFLSR